MGNNNHLQFREEARDALTDPDQLRAAVSIVQARSRWLLWGLIFLVLVVVLWSAWVKVPIKVSGSGVLTVKGRELSMPVMAENGGQVSAVLVQRGQSVNAGDVILRLDQPTASEALREAKTDLRAAKDKLRETMATLQATLVSNESARTQRRESLQLSIDHLNSRLPFLRQREQEMKGMFERQLASQDELERASLERQTAEDDLSRQQADLQQTIAASAAENQALERQRASLNQAVVEAQAEADKREADLDASMSVIARQDGVVGEINALRGDWISSGQRVALITPHGKLNDNNTLELSALLYVPLEKGKRLHAGMAAQLEVSSLIRGTSGKVRAVVSSVSEVAVSEETLSVRLNNDAWTEQILQDGVPFELVLNLLPDSSETSGYEWTTTPGPDIQLAPGTFVTGQIVQQRRSLLSLVLPELRVFFQIDGSRD